ncbi:MAG: glycosyltransferase, partial [Bacteroidota bacterium]
FDRLWQHGYHYKLRLVGDEKYFYNAADTTMGDYLKKKYPSYLQSGLLTMTGALPPGEVKNEMLKAKIVLVPSTVENLPYTVLESMAVGSIVLAAKQGGQSEIIQDNVNGFLFDYTIPATLEEKLHTIYSLPDDKISQLKKEAIRTIERECNPQVYFTEKIKLLERQIPATKTDFPFVSILSNEKRSVANNSDAGNNLLSIVVPYYNMSKFIAETIASIDTSGYKNKEIIIVNDGSNSSESMLLSELYKSRSDIRIIEQQNSGLAATRNRGAQEAKGSFLAFLDADDKIVDDYYQKAIDILIAKENVHFVGSWVQYFGDSDGKWPA